MNTVLQWFNFAGVLAVVALCGFQWQTAYVRDQRVEQLSRIRVEQSAKLDEDSKALDQNQHVLDDLRQQLTASQSAEHEDQTKIASLTGERNKLSDELGQTKAALEKWMAAVNQRDDALKQTADRVDKLVSERNDLTQRFNDLANKYNDAIKELNGGRAK